MKHLALIQSSILAFAGLILTTAAASALVIVVGSTKGQECFVAARQSPDLTRLAQDAAIKVCNEALSDGNMASHDIVGTYVNRGVLYAAQGRQQEAMNDYQHGIRLSPDLGDAYVDRGAALIFLKQYDDAIVDINKGINLGLSYPHVGYYNRAVAEFLKGQYKESYFDYKRALEINPYFKQAEDQLKNFVVTKVPAKGS